MAHEVSKTIKKGKRWYLTIGVGKKKGTVIGNKKGYATSKIADSYAQQRSANYRKRSDRNRGER